MRRRPGESKVYGVNACRAVVARRPDDVLKAFVNEERARELGGLLRQLAQQHRPYRVIPDVELEALTESRHHEGVCLVCRDPAPPRLEELLAAPGRACLLALVGVANPHNVGAILRSAAHFGVRGVLLVGEGARLSAATVRTAEGGAEWVPVLPEPFLEPALAAARRAGFAVAATAARGGRDLQQGALPDRLLILLGAEDQGLPPELAAKADAVLRIPGTGHVESLNVAAATAVLLAEVWRSHQRPDGGPVPRGGPRPARPERPVSGGRPGPRRG